MKSLSVEERRKLVKFNYRIVMSGDGDYPYNIQKKGWLRWKSLGKCRSKDQASSELDKCIRQEYAQAGQVIFEYSNEDYLADKLKNITVYHRINEIR